jgi:TetR/AcrR family tetracycline transcriptional repressor
VTRKRTDAGTAAAIDTATAADGAKERLSRETIVDSALALVDAEGLDAVTIRRLAHDQGVTPMALYWHFRDKERLLDGIAERLLSNVVLPAEGAAADDVPTSWDVRFHQFLLAIIAALREHPAAADLVRTRIMLSTAGLDITESALELLAEAGFDEEQSAQLAGQALGSIVLLVTTEPGLEVGPDAELKEQARRTKRAALQSLPPERYPRVMASVEAFLACGDSQEYFDLGLELFIAGARAVAPARRGSPAVS